MATVQTSSTVNRIGFFIRAPSALAPPPPLLADNIDPETRDFADLFTGADPIDAAVQLALTTVRGSGASVEGDGIKLSPDKMTASLENQLESDARLALRRLTRAGDIRIVAVTFDINDESNQTVQLRVAYKNLRAVDSVTRTSAVPLPGKALI